MMSWGGTQPIGEPPDPGEAAALFAYRWFGCLTFGRRTRPTAGTSVAQILSNNPRRLFWRIQNRSVGNVYVEVGDQPVVGTAILIGPTGGFLESTVQEDGEQVAEAVNGIADLASSQLVVYEVIAV